MRVRHLSIPWMAVWLAGLGLAMSARALSAAPSAPTAAANATPATAPTTAPATTGAAQSRFEFMGWVMAGTIGERSPWSIVEDPAATSVRETTDADGKKLRQNVALMYRVSRSQIGRTRYGITVASTPHIPIATMVPGVYRATARISYDGDTGVVGTPIELRVNGAFGPAPREGFSIVRSIVGCEMEETEKYYDVSMLVEVTAQGDRRPKSRGGLSAYRWGGMFETVYPNAEKPEKKVEPPKGVNEGITVSVTLPRAKWEVGTANPACTLRWVRVDSLRLERVDLSPSLVVRYVRPAKLWLKPGATQQFDVLVENMRDQPCTRELAVSLVRGIDDKRELHRQRITLPPAATQPIRIEWKTDEQTPRWGYEVRAEVRDGEKVDHAASDYFSVHPEAYAVHVMGGSGRGNDPFRRGENYANVIETFAATNGDCAGLLAPKDAWAAGMGTGAPSTSMKLIRYATDHNREQGIASHMYLFTGGTGCTSMDLYVKHPEYFAGPSNMTDNYYAMRKAWEDQIANWDWERKRPPFETPVMWIEPKLNHWFPALKEKIESDAVEFIKRSGYDGIRFDVGLFSPKTARTPLGEPLPFDMGKAQTHAAKNFNDFKDRLRKQNPHIEFGANMDSWSYLDQVGVRKITPQPPENYPEFVAFAGAPGLFVDEGTMNAPVVDHYMNRFEDAIWSMGQKRAVVRRLGGYYQLFGPFRGGGNFNHDDIYWSAFIIASGSYTYSPLSPPPYSDSSIARFITRYSEFFRDKELRPLEGADRAIKVETPSEVWFAETAQWRDIGGKRRYVIPLINPPIVERFRRTKNGEMPKPINEAFDVTVQLPEGYKSAQAWMLTWEPTMMHQQLAVKVSDRSVKVKFPGLQLMRTLVMEFGK